MWHDANRPAAEELFQPLLGYRAFELMQFGCIDAADSDALTPNPNGISIDGMDLEITQQSHFLSCFGSKSGKPGLLVDRLQFVSSFRVPLGSTIRRTFVSRLFVCGEAI